MCDEERAFLRAIAACPEEDARRLVYADWLQEHDREERAAFVRMGFNPAWIPRNPTPSQLAFLMHEGREVLFDGPAGAGKTEALLMSALRYATNRMYDGLILAPTYGGLMNPGGLVERSREWLGGAAKWDGAELRWTFPHGATLHMGYRSLTGKGRYHGKSLCWVGIDDVGEFGREEVGFLRNRLRLVVGVPLQLRMTAGVGGNRALVEAAYIGSGKVAVVRAGIDSNPNLLGSPG